MYGCPRLFFAIETQIVPVLGFLVAIIYDVCLVCA